MKCRGTWCRSSLPSQLTHRGNGDLDAKTGVSPSARYTGIAHFGLDRPGSETLTDGHTLKPGSFVFSKQRT